MKKLNVDYEEIYKLKENLKAGHIKFSEDECTLMFTILEAIKGDYYPAAHDLIQYEKDLKQLKELEKDMTHHTDEVVNLVKKIQEFEQKYHGGE